jgi:ATP-dependent Clp endopeptidase proteolytic subunit ClpP
LERFVYTMPPAKYKKGVNAKCLYPATPKDDEELEPEPQSSVVRENNVIYLYSEIDRDSIFKLLTLLREAEEYCVLTSLKTRIDEIPIYIHINSYGGCIHSAFAAIDAIQKCRVPVYSVIEGAAASAGTLISVVCAKRYIRPNAYMLIHQLSSSVWGKMSEIEDEYRGLEEMMERITQLYMNHSKMRKKNLDKLLKHDLWLTPETALDYGLVDELY